MGFFDQYPRFYVTSHTSPVPHRLNARCAAVIDSVRDKLTSARVLGIASHDGRRSFAALRAGRPTSSVSNRGASLSTMPTKPLPSTALM